MANKKSVDIRQAEDLLAPAERGVILLPVSAIRESDHAFFWAAFFLAISACLLGSAAALMATAYEHQPFIIMIEAFGAMFLIFFAAFLFRGMQIRRKSRAREQRRLARQIVYPYAENGGYKQDVEAGRLQDTIRKEFGDGKARSRQEVIGILSGMSTEDVDVGTLNEVVDTLVKAGLFTETESSGKTLLAYNKPAEA